MSNGEINYQNLPIVEVLWEDICVTSGWETGDVKHGVSQCRSVGYLLEDKKNTITISGDIGVNGSTEFNRKITFPRGCIKQILFVEPSDKSYLDRLNDKRRLE